MTYISLKIMSVAQLVTTFIFFSACDKSHVKWDNTQESNTENEDLCPSNPRKKIIVEEIL